MSADNYYLIRKHPLGGFAAVMGFASNDSSPEVNPTRDAQFDSLDAAVYFGLREYSEYGVEVHPECYENEPFLVVPVLTAAEAEFVLANIRWTKELWLDAYHGAAGSGAHDRADTYLDKVLCIDSVIAKITTQGGVK